MPAQALPVRQEAEHASAKHGQVHASIRLRRARMRMARREQSIDQMLKVARGERADEAQLGLRAPYGGGEDASVRETLGLTASDVATVASGASANTDQYTQSRQSHDETACPAELWDWFTHDGTCRSRSPRSPSLSPSSRCSSRSRSPRLSPSSGCSSRIRSPSLSPSSRCSSRIRSSSLSPSSGSSCSGSEFERSQDSTPSPRPSPTPSYCSLM
jgi:hypothetical protein